MHFNVDVCCDLEYNLTALILEVIITFIGYVKIFNRQDLITTRRCTNPNPRSILDFELCDLQIWVNVIVYKARAWSQIDCFYGASHGHVGLMCGEIWIFQFPIRL